jgi:threonine dehydrogenase-like Zn-dependent dehydrogenase
MFFFGVCPNDATIRVKPYDVFRNDWKIVGSFALRYTFQEAIRLLSSGAIKVEPLISHRLPLDQAADAFDRLQRDPKRIKIIVEP